MGNFFQSKIIYLILMLGLLLRLVALNQSLWLDEAIGALVVKEETFSQIVSQFPKSDNHPPLYYLTLKAWTNIFGYSEASLRMPSVIFGVGTVFFVYLIARKLLKEKFFPYFSALLIATSPFHIYYSQEARMYMMAAFLASASIYFYLKTFEKDSKFWIWLLFSLALTALIFTDYVPVFLLPVFWIYAFVRKADQKWWKKFLISHLLIIILGLMWLPMFTFQIERGKWILKTLPTWQFLAGGATIKQLVLVWTKFVLGRISFQNKFFYYLLLILFSIPFGFSIFSAWRTRKKVTLVWWWLVFPLIFGFLFSFLFPAFIYFRFTYLTPAFYLLIAWGVNQYQGLLKNILVALILSINILGWLFYVGAPYQQKEQWRQAVAFIESKALMSDIVVFENPEPFAPYRWYMGGKVEAKGVTDSISPSREKTNEITRKAIDDKKGIYYFEYLRDLMDPKRYVEEAIVDSGFIVDNVYANFPGVGQITYWVKQ